MVLFLETLDFGSLYNLGNDIQRMRALLTFADSQATTRPIPIQVCCFVFSLVPVAKVHLIATLGLSVHKTELIPFYFWSLPFYVKVSDSAVPHCSEASANEPLATPPRVLEED
jgi:hypothetical protein